MVKSYRGRSLASSVRASQEDSAPALLPETDTYAKIIESRGKGQFLVTVPSNPASLLVYMPPKFRHALWIRRGSFVIIRRYAKAADSNENELLHILSPEQIKEIKRDGCWPAEFTNEILIESEESEESEEAEEADEQSD